MKIRTGGTPIWIAPRHDDDKGVIIMQGSSRIMISGAELPQVLDAIQQMVDA